MEGHRTCEKTLQSFLILEKLLCWSKIYLHHARRGVGGPLNPKSATCGADSPPEALRVGKRHDLGVMKVGSHATGTREPGQARKGAAISGTPCVPWGSPAGASGSCTSRFGEVEGGSVVHFGFTYVEILIVLFLSLIFTFVSLLLIRTVLRGSFLVINKTQKIMDKMFLIDYVGTEYMKECSKFLEITDDSLHFLNKSGKRVTYIVKNVGDTWKVVRKSDGEGNNVLYEGKEPVSFSLVEHLWRLNVGKHSFEFPINPFSRSLSSYSHPRDHRERPEHSPLRF